jgi:hypothetical protein
MQIKAYLLDTWRCKNAQRVWRMNSCILTISICCFLVTLSIFLGLFLGLEYPQISRSETYIGTACTIDSSMIVNSYCPQKVCDEFCVNGPASLPSCDSIQNIQKALDPYNSSIVSNTPCTDGPKCCEYTHSECRICTQHCSSKLQSSCYMSCTYYDCNFRCLRSIKYNSCMMVPQICYAATLNITYENSNGDFIQTSYTQQKGTNLQAAHDFIESEYQTSHTYPCWYDKNDGSKILWDISYTLSYIILNCIFGFLLLISIVVLSYPILLKCIMPSSIGQGEEEIHQWSFLSFFTIFWSWTISFCAILPIYYAASMSKNTRIVILVLFYQFLTLGLVPYIICRYDDIAIIVYMIIVWILTGWVVPILSWYASFYMAIAVCVVSILLFLMFLCNDRDKVFFFSSVCCK